VKPDNFLKNIHQKLRRAEAVRPFTEPEAWGLFRLAALAEAVGWTLLISGILIRQYHLLGSGVAVPIAGRIHGTFFLIYFGVLAATYTSLRWSRWKFLAAIMAGVPPYGSLIFEQWAAHNRRNRLARQHYRIILLSRITQPA